MPFQVDGIEWMLSKLAEGGGASPSPGVILADEMGLSWAKRHSAFAS